MLKDELVDLYLFAFELVSGCRLAPLVSRLRVIDTYKYLVINSIVTWSTFWIVFLEHLKFGFELVSCLDGSEGSLR